MCSFQHHSRKLIWCTEFDWHLQDIRWVENLLRTMDKPFHFYTCKRIRILYCYIFVLMIFISYLYQVQHRMKIVRILWYSVSCSDSRSIFVSFKIINLVIQFHAPLFRTFQIIKEFLVVKFSNWWTISDINMKLSKGNSITKLEDKFSTNADIKWEIL